MPSYLSFSDGAKIADIARNIAQGNGYGSTFSSFGADKEILNHLNLNVFPAWGRQPLMSYSVAIFYKLFGVGDLGLILTSVIFYLLSIIGIYIFAKNIFSEKIGFISALSFIFIPTFWEYALTGASESLFILEVVLTFLLLTLKNKRIKILGLVVAGLSYFTRPQGFILIVGALTYYLLISSKSVKSALLKLIVVVVIGIVVDLTLFTKFTGKTFLYSILSKGADVSVLYTTSLPGTTGLRQSVDAKDLLISNGLEVGKKVFYNFYNLYKLMPDIMPSFIFILFILSMFIREEERRLNYLKYTFLFMFLLSILSTSASIPFFRYLHPFVPLLLMFAVFTLSKFVKFKFVYILVFIYLIANSLGILFLDSRFIANTKNTDKPPIYVLLSQKLKENTKDGDLIVTNLDTWGSWYGERRTIWFPLDPKVIIESSFDAIYLISYKMNDENYYMNNDWRYIFNNPEDQKILSQYELEKEFVINSEDTYENEPANAILLVKKVFSD